MFLLSLPGYGRTAGKALFTKLLKLIQQKKSSFLELLESCFIIKANIKVGITFDIYVYVINMTSMKTLTLFFSGLYSV